MRIRVTGVPKVMKPEAEAILREELDLALRQVGGAFAAQVKLEIKASKPFAPIDQSTLFTGIQFIRTPGQLRGVVAPSKVAEPYAVVQELGRRPGQPGPPMDPILRWVERKFGVHGGEAKQIAFLVRRKLHAKGMPGRFFFRRARSAPVAWQKSRSLVHAAVRRWRRRVSTT